MRCREQQTYSDGDSLLLCAELSHHPIPLSMMDELRFNPEMKAYPLQSMPIAAH